MRALQVQKILILMKRKTNRIDDAKLDIMIIILNFEELNRFVNRNLNK